MLGECRYSKRASPWRVTLGELDAGAAERYFSRFNSLHTIRVPVENAARIEFLKKHRRHRLAAEFARDLHRRLFRAFASLGFDDDNWWTDGDRKFLVERGNSIRKAREAQVEAARSEITALDMAGAGQKDKNKMTEQLAQAEKQLAKANEVLEPLLGEHQVRFGSGKG